MSIFIGCSPNYKNDTWLYNFQRKMRPCKEETKHHASCQHPKMTAHSTAVYENTCIAVQKYRHMRSCHNVTLPCTCFGSHKCNAVIHISQRNTFNSHLIPRCMGQHDLIEHLPEGSYLDCYISCAANNPHICITLQLPNPFFRINS